MRDVPKIDESRTGEPDNQSGSQVDVGCHVLRLLGQMSPHNRRLVLRAAWVMFGFDEAAEP